MADKGLLIQGNGQPRDGDIPIETLRRLLQGLRYGTLELTVHDGRVVQIERRERVRLG
jgi:hypothetical protein